MTPENIAAEPKALPGPEAAPVGDWGALLEKSTQYCSSNPQAALEFALQAKALTEASGDAEASAHASVSIFKVHLRTHDYANALAAAEQAVQLAAGTDSAALHGMAHYCRGAALCSNGRLVDGLADLAYATPFLKSAADWLHVGEALNIAASTCGILQLWEEADGLFEQIESALLNEALPNHHQYALAVYHNNRAYLQSRMASEQLTHGTMQAAQVQLSNALVHANKAIDIAKGISFDALLVQCVGTKANILILCQRTNEARDLLDTLDMESEILRASPLKFHLHALRGEIQLLLGDPVACINFVRPALDVYQSSGNKQLELPAAKLLARAYHQLGDRASAFDYLTLANELESRQGHHLTQQRALLLARRFKSEQELRSSLGTIEFMAHDLRSPLYSLSLAAAELGRTTSAAGNPGDNSSKDAEPDAAQLVATIERLAQRALGLTNDFLVFVRADHLDATRFEPLALAELVEEVCDDAIPAAKAKSLLMEFDLDIDIIVSADRSLLRRAVGNLLDNAIKANPCGARISITVDERQGQAQLTIRDQGPGFPDAVRSHGFEMFCPSNHTNGAGLGLAMAQKVAQLHGGHVSISNDSGAVVEWHMPLTRQ